MIDRATVEIVTACGMHADGSRFVGSLVRWGERPPGQLVCECDIWESHVAATEAAERLSRRLSADHLVVVVRDLTKAADPVSQSVGY